MRDRRVGRGLWSALSALAAGSILLVSASVASPSGDAKRGGTLRLMSGAEPDSIDPALAGSGRGGWMLLFATCAKLFNYSVDAGTGKARLVPEVVRTFDVSNGGRTYTFQLRRTFRFNTGAPVIAQSFADALNRDARMRSPSRRFMDEINGAGDVIEGKVETIAGVRVLGPYRLQIRLTRPISDLPDRLTMPFFCPLLPGTPTRPIERPPGSGPYYIAERVPNRRTVLERNPYYRGTRPANPDRIVLTIEPDPDTRIRATEQNGNDWMGLYSFPDPVVRALVSKYGVNRAGGRLLRSPTLVTYFFVFNPERPAFQGAGQKPLEKAINYALDRSALTRAHGYLAGKRTDRLLPPTLSDTQPTYPLARADPKTGLKWLARAAQRPKTLTLYTVNSVFGAPTAQAVATSLRRLGIDVIVKYFEVSTLLQKLSPTAGEPWDIAWLPWNAWYADPAGSLVLLFDGTRHEARVDAVNRLTGAARRKAWAHFEADVMRNDPPVAAYMNPAGLTLLSRSFGCYRFHPVYDIDLAAACKK